MNRSVAYYNENAEDFFNRTVNVDLQNFHEKFCSLLSENAHILDLGCGSGRDARYFKLHNFKITALDASEELGKLASAHIGQDVLHMSFEDMTFQNMFEGIWANASLIHVPYEDLEKILKKIHASLKDNGIFYATFKYGDTKRTAGDRDFYDMNETLIKSYLPPFFDLMTTEKEKDTRSQVAPSTETAWLHIWCKKNAILL